MTTFHIISSLILLTALFSYVNNRFLHLPGPVGTAALGMATSMLLVLGSKYSGDVASAVGETIAKVKFSDLILHGALGFLLFSGSMRIRLSEISREKWTIIPLATVAVTLSTFLVGGGFYYVTRWLDGPIPFLQCLLFGALISPTDPIAVLALLKRAGVPLSLQVRISGESLFNDGTSIVIFMTLLNMIGGRGGEGLAYAGEIGLLFMLEVIGAIVFGILVGYGACLLIRKVDNYAVETLITLALATAGYAAADTLHLSAPIATSIMGLIVGNYGKRSVMSKETVDRLFSFWDVLDELLNLLLFGLIGLVMVMLKFSPQHLAIALAAIGLVLAARLLSIAGPILATPRLQRVAKVTLPIMTWGGLRGGISIALALALPDMEGRELIITSTYAVVIFSILVQALTLQRVVKFLLKLQRGKRQV